MVGKSTMKITRIVNKEESLAVKPCPNCKHTELVITDNPGCVLCPNCKIFWNFSYVNDQWDCVKQWNKLVNKIEEQLKWFDLIKIDRYKSISRDFIQEELEDQATAFLKEIKNQIIKGLM